MRTVKKSLLSQVSVSSMEYEKKLQQDFDKRQIEIRMEAENAVRERERALNDEVVRLREQLERHQSRQQEVVRQKMESNGKKEGEEGCGIM